MIEKFSKTLRLQTKTSEHFFRSFSIGAASFELLAKTLELFCPMTEKKAWSLEKICPTAK
ncbi:hypothetical protein A1342_06475 [Methylomonas methanica]|uniref:Uncharacterized protein n=1 Tax=Methylomonas denitrificans TaxID=1538553 RepID=A0A126T9S2_9GAMM|nr:hypothetical protein JT25_018955 [Methylomonas denitrificans]OAI06454.1 hypothetical protein A1342_06475 [Methylomonas methanica]